MPLSEDYNVNFDEYIKDLTEQALNRMLSQHYGRCVLRQFVAAIMSEVQVLYDAIVNMQKMRSPYYAEGENLNALGRIVGEPRKPWMYSDEYYLKFDTVGQTPDLVPVWCKNAELGIYKDVDDSQYRVNIIAKAIKNHTLTSSVNEVGYVIKMLLDIKVSFVKTGPNQIDLVIHGNVSLTGITLLTRGFDDNMVDDRFAVPYPATLSIRKLVFAPIGYLMFDNAETVTDKALVAVGV